MLALARLPALLVLLAALLLTGACGDDDAPVEDQDPGQLDLSAAQVGEDVTAFGTVTDVLSINSFELSGALANGEPLLVIAPEAVPLEEGYRVTVEGSVEAFEDGSISRYGLDGADLPDVEAGQRFVLADTVDAPITGSNSD